jgi:hypothetical protein
MQLESQALTKKKERDAEIRKVIRVKGKKDEKKETT